MMRPLVSLFFALACVLAGPALLAEGNRFEVATADEALRRTVLSAVTFAAVWAALFAAVGLITVLRAALPRSGDEIEKATTSHSRWKLAIIGLVNTAFLLGVASSKAPGGVRLAAVVVLLCLALAGAIGEVSLMGRRILYPGKPPESVVAPRATLGGGFVLMTAAPFPVLGWLLFLYVFVKSVGIAVIWMLGRLARPREGARRSG